jgi:hypothetical protein
MFLNRLVRLKTIHRLGDDSNICLLEQGFEPNPDHLMVIGDHDFNGHDEVTYSTRSMRLREKRPIGWQWSALWKA